MVKCYFYMKYFRIFFAAAAFALLLFIVFIVRGQGGSAAAAGGDILKPEKALTRDEALVFLRDSWRDRGRKVTIRFADGNPDKSAVLALMNSAETSCGSLAAEAERVCYQTSAGADGGVYYEMWCSFGGDSGILSARQEALDEKLSEISEALGPRADYETVYRFVSDNVSYDNSLALVSGMGRLAAENYYKRCAYGALVDGRTVCTGYARAFEAICHSLGLECWVVTGSKNGVTHAWNVVGDQGVRKYIDCAVSPEERVFLLDDAEMEARGYALDPDCRIPSRYGNREQEHGR